MSTHLLVSIVLVLQSVTLGAVTAIWAKVDRREERERPETEGL